MLFAVPHLVCRCLRSAPRLHLVWLLSVACLLAHSVLAGEENTGSEWAKLVERVKPSVVVVSFAGRDGQQQGLGSGFVVDPDGLIATNLHVVGEARPISVRTIEGQDYPVVSVHATDRAQDLAILKIEAQNLPALPLGDSDSLQQGQSIVALGNPLGLEHSVVTGIISAVREEVDGQPLIQLAIPIERGNSGGPVLDRQGNVLGLVNLKSQLTDNLGYAVGVNALKPLLEEPNPVPMSRWLTIGRLNPRLWQVPEDVRWWQRAGHIHVSGRGKGFGGRSLIFSRQELPEVPLELAVSVKMDEEDGAAGLIFHADGDDRHYGFYPSSGNLRLSRFDGPDVYSWNVLDEQQSDAYRPGEWNRLKVRIEQDLIQCFCNDELVFESRDARYTSGQVGLAKFRHTTATFKQFEVGVEVRSQAPAPEIKQQLLTLLDEVPSDRAAGAETIEGILSVTNSQSAGVVLREQARELDRQAQRIRQLADAVHTRAILRDLAALFEQEQVDIDLIRAALLVAALDNDELEIESYQAQVDELAQAINERIPEQAGDVEKRQALHAMLFEEQGFHGSRTNYDHASNSYLNEVLDDREGLPITLSVLYLALAERIGLSATGIGLPGHFVVRVRDGEDWQLVDVFDRGQLLSEEEAARKVSSITGLPWRQEYLEPQSPRAIIVRMLRNLINVANRSEDVEAGLRYVSALLTLQPDSAVDRLYRAVLCYNTQRTEQGLADVAWLLEHQPEAIPLFRIQQLKELIETQQAQ